MRLSRAWLDDVSDGGFLPVLVRLSSFSFAVAV